MFVLLHNYPPSPLENYSKNSYPLRKCLIPNDTTIRAQELRGQSRSGSWSPGDCRVGNYQCCSTGHCGLIGIHVCPYAGNVYSVLYGIRTPHYCRCPIGISLSVSLSTKLCSSSCVRCTWARISMQIWHALYPGCVDSRKFMIVYGIWWCQQICGSQGSTHSNHEIVPLNQETCWLVMFTGNQPRVTLSIFCGNKGYICKLDADWLRGRDTSSFDQWVHNTYGSSLRTCLVPDRHCRLPCTK